MKWRKDKLKRIFALALSVVLAGTSADFTVLATESTDIQYEQADESDSRETETKEIIESDVMESEVTESEKIEEASELSESAETLETMEKIETIETIETTETLETMQTIESTESVLESEDVTMESEEQETFENTETSVFDLVEEEIIDAAVREGENTATSGDFSIKGDKYKSVYWDYNVDSGLLTITGSGEMPNFYIDNDPRPWGDCIITSISVEGDITHIGNNTFKQCDELISAELPNVVSVGNYAFNGCDKLENVYLPDATSVGASAFASCKSMTSIYIPNLESADNYSFQYCSSLEEIDIKKLTTLGEYAFFACDALISIDLPELKVVSKSAFASCKKLTSVKLPNVTSLGESAFITCTSLSHLELPNVETIDTYALYGCKSLTSLDMPKLTTLGTQALFGTSSLESLNVPNLTTVGKKAFSYCGIRHLELPNVTTVGQQAFWDDPNTPASSSLISISLPKVTSIGMEAFYTCINLESISIPQIPYSFDGAAIGADAFSGCTSLNTITIGCPWKTKVEAAAGFYGVKLYGSNKTRNYSHLEYVSGNVTASMVNTTTIKYKCHSSCFGINVTLEAPDNPCYTGNPVEVKCATDSGFDLTTIYTPSITYAYKDSGEALEGAPVECGTYIATLTVLNKSISIEYTIGIAKPTADMFEFKAPENLTYDGNAKAATVTVKGNSSDTGNITVKYYKDGNLVSPEDVIDIGTYTVKIDVTESDNFQAGEVSSDDWTFTITKGDLQAEVIGNELAYTGEPQQLVSLSGVLPQGCKAEYRLDGESWAEAIPTAVNAGEYTVYYRIEETDFYNAKEGSVDVNIAKADYEDCEINREYLCAEDNSDSVSLQELIPEDCGQVGYGTPVMAGNIVYTQAPMIEGGILSYTVAAGSGDKEGTITIAVETQNYKAFNIVIGIKQIAQKAVMLKEGSEVALNNNVLNYGEALSELTFKPVDFVDGDGNDVAGTLAWKKPEIKPTVGTTDAAWIFTPDDTASYDILEGTVAITVYKAVPIVIQKPSFSEITFDPESKLVDIELLGGLVTGIDSTVITGTWSWKDEEIVPAANNGGYTAVFTPQDTDSYQTIDVLLQLPVKKAQACVTIEENKRSYAKTLADEEFELEGITFTGLGELTYAVSDISETNSRSANRIITVSETGVVSIHGAGRAAVYVSTTETANYNAAEPQVIYVDISKLEMSVEPVVNNSLLYTGQSHHLVSLNGVPEGSIVEYRINNEEWSVEIPSAVNAGEYTVYYRISETDRYNAKEGSVSVSIAKASAEDLEFDKEYVCSKDNSDRIKLGEILSEDFSNASYGTPVTIGNIAYTQAPVIEGEILSYTVESGSADTEGAITIAVNTQNYESFMLTINIKLTGKKPVSMQYGGEVSLNSNVLTCGEPLSKLTFKPAVFTDSEGNEVQGTLTWKEPELKPALGTSGATWVFIPDDSDTYETLEGTVAITVNKLTALVNIEADKKKYTKIMSDEDFALEGITFTGDGVLTYTVSDAKTSDGQTAAAESIITVSESGTVSIHGTGSANIYVSTTETENCHSAQAQVISVEIGLGDEFYVEGKKAYVYTGSAIKPEFTVYDGLNGALTLKKDYTVAYKNNKNTYTLKEGEAGFDATKAPQAIIKGKGRYSAKITVYFTIQPKDISEDDGIAVKEILLEENSKVQKKVPTVTYNKKKLKGVIKPDNGTLPANMKDFMYSYPDTSAEAYTKAGTWKILV